MDMWNARSHNHLFSFEDGGLPKSGRRLDTPTACIRFLITASCCGVDLECCGPLSCSKEGSDVLAGGAEREAMDSILLRLTSNFHDCLLASVAGAGRLFVLHGWPKRVSMCNHIQAYTDNKNISLVDPAQHNFCELTADLPPCAFFFRGTEPDGRSVNRLTTCESTVTSCTNILRLRSVSANACWS